MDVLSRTFIFHEIGALIPLWILSGQPSALMLCMLIESSQHLCRWAAVLSMRPREFCPFQRQQPWNPPGNPIKSGMCPFETTTPTGAAILAATVDHSPEAMNFTPRKIGPMASVTGYEIPMCCASIWRHGGRGV